MTFFALGLVLTSAVLHASWNLMAKKSTGGAPFTLLILWLSLLIFAPLAIFLCLSQMVRFGWPELIFITGSGLLHLTYFLVLQKGYRVGDLSLVYPLARGTGPALSTVAAILFLGERPSFLAFGGMLLIVAGVFALSYSARRSGTTGLRQAVLFGLLTGTLIAGYNLWDKQALTVTSIQPILLYYFSMVVQGVLLLPIVVRYQAQIKELWRDFRKETVGAAIFSPLSYFIYLTALSFSPVSYVAPAREVSILIGVIFGAKLLAEGDSQRRLWAAGAVVAGVIALAFG